MGIRSFIKKFIAAILAPVVLAHAAFEVNDMIELTGFVNARSSARFLKNSGNIEQVLPAGTLGRIEEQVKFPSGKYGIKIEVAKGDSLGQSFWVYYNPENPHLKLFNEEAEDVSVPVEKAHSAELTQEQKAIVEQDDFEKNATAGMKAHLAFILPKIKPRLPGVELESDQVPCVSTLEQRKASPPIPFKKPLRQVLTVSPRPVDPSDLKDAGKPLKSVYNADSNTGREELFKNYERLGGSPLALKQALCFHDRYQGTTFSPPEGKKRLSNERFITINDQTRRSDTNRLFVLDLKTGRVRSYYTGHGNGGKEVSTVYAPGFSNEGGSNLTPRGFFVTGIQYSGQFGPNSMKLHGLQKGINDNSYQRPGGGIVMHPFPMVGGGLLSLDSAYASDKAQPPLYRDQSTSEGCTILDEKDIKEFLPDIKNGSLYYTYTPTEKNAGENYCGETGLLTK